MVRDAGGQLFKKSVHFIDRHPFATCEIVNCYRDGFLPVKPPNIPVEVWQNELLYFRMHKCSSTIPGLDGFLKLYSQDDDEKDPNQPMEGTWQHAVYNILEDPKSSSMARFIAIVSMMMVCLSVGTVCKYRICTSLQTPFWVAWRRGASR